jgi:capsular exopolysaccharide synthesis family protein
MVERRTNLTYPTWPLPAPMPEEDAVSEGIDLRGLWQTILHRRWTILIVTAIVIAGTLTHTLMQTPIYRASLTLQIDTEDQKASFIDEMDRRMSPYLGMEYLQTQYELLRSRSLAERLAEKMGPGDVPIAIPPTSPLLQLKTWLASWLPGADRDTNGNKNESVADRSTELSKYGDVPKRQFGGWNVTPIKNTRIVRLDYDSHDPKYAAAVLNTLAKTYIDLNLERRYDATTYARNFLQERLQQVKEKLEESERELVEFSRREQIISVDQKETIIASNLTAANAALIDAERKRIAAESVYRQVQSSHDEGLSQVLDSKLIQDLKQNKAKLEAEYQQNLSEYKPGYPEMVQLRNRINQVESVIAKEVANIRSSITSQYEAAKSEESQLRSKLERMKQELLALQDRSVPLQILRREADTNRQLYDGLLQRYKEVGVSASIGSNNISVVDSAQVPSAPYKPDLRHNLLMSLAVGLLGGIGLAFLFERLDDTFRRPEQFERLIDLPMLGVVPKFAVNPGDDRAIALIGHDDPRSSFAEAYRSVRTSLQFSTASGVPRLLTVTSAMPGEGKSATAVSLAIQFAQSGKQTLIVEADLRKPTLHRNLKLNNQVGLTNYLAGGEVHPVDISFPTHIPNLFAIPSGPMPPNPAELLSSPRMIELLALAAEKFDQVILDSPPLLGLADALIIGNLCDGTLLTVAMGSTPRSYVSSAVKRLRSARVPLIGAILTKMDSPSGASGYYQSYYYYYQRTGYYGEAPAADSKRVPA